MHALTQSIHPQDNVVKPVTDPVLNEIDGDGIIGDDDELWVDGKTKDEKTEEEEGEEEEEEEKGTKENLCDSLRA